MPFVRFNFNFFLRSEHDRPFDWLVCSFNSFVTTLGCFSRSSSRLIAPRAFPTFTKLILCVFPFPPLRGLTKRPSAVVWTNLDPSPSPDYDYPLPSLSIASFASRSTASFSILLRCISLSNRFAHSEMAATTKELSFPPLSFYHIIPFPPLSLLHLGIHLSIRFCVATNLSCCSLTLSLPTIRRSCSSHLQSGSIRTFSDCLSPDCPPRFS